MEILVKDYRGELEDLVHPGIITIVDYEGNLLHSIGDEKRFVFARSSMKPIQALSVVESGAFEHYKISDRELAVMCASHSGEEYHENSVRSILAKGGLDESYLKCGIHLPFNEKRKKEFVKRGIEPREIHNNCSGKHSGMLITSKYLGYDLDHYFLVNHDIQNLIIKNISEICDFPKEDIKIGVDGCGVPVHALPMYNIAYGFARFIKPDVFDEGRQKAMKKIADAMSEYPEMVGGTDRICTDLMKHFGDRLIAKGGANGFYMLAIKDKGIGIAIKMLDGTTENLPIVIFEVLEKLGVIEREELKSFNKIHTNFNVYNHRKEVVGRKEIAFSLVHR